MSDATDELGRKDSSDDSDEAWRRLLAWCDSTPARQLVVVCKAHGEIAHVSLDVLPPSVSRFEGLRRSLIIRGAWLAAAIESGHDGDEVQVYRSDQRDVSVSDLADVEPLLRDFRLRPGWIGRPIDDATLDWWDKHRGWITVTCSRHGTLLRIDASRSIAMLAPAWDSAVAEYHARWENAWDETYDTDAYDGCDVRISAESSGDQVSLLDVRQLWIHAEWPKVDGDPWEWWPHGLFSDTP